MIVDVVIPALNEEDSIGRVLAEIEDPRVRRVVVVDNGSSDRTAQVARAAGAVVVFEPQRGYGRACLTGLALLRADPPDVVAFVDADYSDYPEQLGELLDQVAAGADLVIGSRTANAEPGALMPQAVFGNWLATRLVSRLYGVEFTDLGPFRAVRWSTLRDINMQDEDFGWTVEMQVKAAKLGASTAEVPVGYRRRVGVSKISGTLKGTVRAGHKILWTIFREHWTEVARGSSDADGDGEGPGAGQGEDADDARPGCAVARRCGEAPGMLHPRPVLPEPVVGT